MKYSTISLLASILGVTASPIRNDTALAERGYHEYTWCGLKNPSTGEDIGAYDPNDLQNLANDLSDNGDCGVDAGPGTCVRVACGNTSGIFLCNDNPNPITIPCSTVSATVGRYGFEDNILQTCTYDADPSFDPPPQNGLYRDTDNWTVFAAYANCNVDTSLGPFDQ